jgi:hypothetical protein
MALRKAGLVGTEKNGREVLYHLLDPYRTQIILEMSEIIQERNRVQKSD